MGFTTRKSVKENFEDIAHSTGEICRILRSSPSRSILYWLQRRIYNDKADSYPQHVGKFFNSRIFIEFFIHEVKKTFKFWVSGPYLYNKYQ